ncbi:hypothetical protein Mh1961_20590 [Mannheimia haemolytica]
MQNMTYYIYLDTKIIGAARQIVTFFDNGVFSREQVIVLIKKYKHISAKQLKKLFQYEKIRYRFVLASDLDVLERGVIFYPFNAESNCRAAANRKLKHIFITHGESNKISSVKPIIRIYDYVITAGKAGIDRFLSHKIFNHYDIESGRLMMMGDTFIGRTGLSPLGKGKKSVFYAPTWEGGIEQENYSSLSNIGYVEYSLSHICERYNIDTIVIKSHPNTGHRRKEYITNLITLITKLLERKFEVILFKPHVNFPFRIVWSLRHKGLKFKSQLGEYYAAIGFCDISAIETQLLNENIFYYLFCNTHLKKYLSRLKNSEYYYSNALEFTEKTLPTSASMEYFNNLRNYTIDRKLDSIPISERIHFLLDNLYDNAEYD